MCENLCMTKTEHIRSLIDAVPKGALVRTTKLVEALACHVGCPLPEASGAVRQVLLSLERDGQISRACRGVYVKTGGEAFDATSEQTRLKVADMLFVAGGQSGYYRGWRALEAYGLDELAESTIVRIASNESTGRQPASAKELGVVVEKPTTDVDEKNAKYLQALDLISDNIEALMALSDDAVQAFFAQLEAEGVDYRLLLGFASKYSSVRTVRAAARLCERLL